MAAFKRIPSNNPFTTTRVAVGAICAGMVIASASGAAADGAASFWSWNGPAYNWNGFYAGGHFGVAAGSSNWTTPTGQSGSVNFFQPINSFDEGGSFFTGLQGGYNYLLPNRLLIGAEVDASFPAFQALPIGVNPFGLSTGGTSNFISPTLGPVSYEETVLSEGTVRARLGYAPGHWLYYVTGGFAWSYDQQALTQIATGNSVTPFLWRLGWTAGAGVEVPIAPHWAARVEYLFKDYGASTTNFFGLQPIRSDLELHEARIGLDYEFGGDPQQAGPVLTKAPVAVDPNEFSFHGQSTFVEQGYPSFRSPFMGAQSLPGGSIGRETVDVTLYAGAKLWKGAELWIDPEIDQGHGLAETHGAAGFPSGESYKQGFTYPYARVNRYFIRQTIDLGGATQKVEDDVNQFAGSQTSNRLVLTVGKFAIVDIFDTNKYANNPKIDFLNWASINAGTFDYAGDAWGYTYGGAAEWYQGIFAFRAGVFDMSANPAESGTPASAPSYGLDSTFSQQQFVGEIEERHELWGEPGKLKITAFVTHGRMGDFAGAVALSQPGEPFAGDVNDALVSLRTYRLRPGVSLNLEQQVNDTVGVFARAGWADGQVEPWDFTDIDRTVQAGVSINGKSWGRPDDTIGLLGIINGLDPAHIAFFNAGGLGVLIGDGQLPSYGLEQIIETYYSYALTASTKISADYQFILNPGYNAQRGPVNVFAGRFHWQF